MAELELYESTEESGWVCDSDEKAEWAARKVKEEAAERDRLLALVKAERERLDAREEEINRRYEQKTEYLTTQLLSYMATVKTRDTATQSKYELLNATLVYKKAAVDVHPAEGLADWLEENHPEFVETTRSVKWGEVKKHIKQIGKEVFAFDDTGEVMSGIIPKEIPGKLEVK